MLRGRLGVRSRILAIALVPSLALLVIGVGAAGYLLREGQRDKEFATVLESGNKHTREMIAAVEQERMLSLWQLSGEQSDRAALGAARQRLDAALRDLATTETQLNDAGWDRVDADLGNFATLQQQLPVIRGRIDSGAMPLPDAYGIYSRLLGGVAVGTALVAADAPDATMALHLAGALRILRAMEAVSRADALTAAAAGPGLPQPLAAEYQNLVGYYRSELPQLAADLSKSQTQLVESILNSPAWQQLAAMEEALIHPGSAKPGAPPPLPMSLAEWRAAADHIDAQLLQLWQVQNDLADRAAYDSADASARNSLLGGAGALVIAVAAFLVSLWLANRLIGRLRRLRTETLTLAETSLPETMRKLAAGEDVDPETAAARLDFGHDEIGSVAKAFNRAHTAAVAAAITEARTREGVRAVFLNIAHRSQIVVHRQLEILDEAEQRQEDPALLDTFFRLDHLATRERRNAENLIILGGGEPGRQWRRPVPLVELVRSAVGETLDYTRVRMTRLPQVFIIGTVVGDLIHLVAELVDNATSFSPPQSRVEITGNLVGKGVIVEISDQGVGMSEEDRERLNEMLRRPPDFGVATLSENSRLGLFVVAQLSARHGISVRLTDSDYGGTRAIVLVPTALITTDAPLADHLPQRAVVRRTERPETGQLPVLEAETVPEPVATLPPARPRTEEPRPSPARYTGTDSRPPLPRRRRQASLAPELAERPDDDTGPQRARSAEQARDLMSAIENGTRQGRRADPGRTATQDEQEGEGDLFQHR
ncbi:sensor histidine kinase [Nocardia blacklockiae]|uniref:sensor histidine kinase n=1 Tax=Nocardia blacklockiae TaxID=480036 RepID=UPI001892E858|nr:nitrate- and nitrite sensing domain-containing protein [Nocardia blacklockiae]MBF6170716.1 sensor histidine kinase [Nocardia blacklockiae]